MMRNVSIVLLLSVLSANAFAVPEIATWPVDDLMQENKQYSGAATLEHLGQNVLDTGRVKANVVYAFSVPAGKYLPKNTNSVLDCKPGFYCPGNTTDGYLPNLTTDQGIVACPIGTSSSGGASGIQDCVASTTTKSIIYHVNDGTACENEEYTVGVLKTLDCNTTKTGYVFKGWFMSSDLSGSAVTEIPTSATEDKELYAKWTAQEYSIDYVMNNGTNYNDAPTSYTIETATINLGTPTRTGYTFKGWYTSSDFTGSAVTQITKGSTGDITLYAHWKMTASICTKGTYLSEDAQSCVKCPTEYPDSDDGAESVSECYKDIATTCIQTEGPVPTNCSGVTEWNECSCTGTYRQYYDTHIVGATTEECTKTVKSLEAPLGYYVYGTTCLACASKPDNAEYTDSDNCAWACNAHYEKSGDICIACSSKNTTETESVTGGTRTRSVTYDNNASGSSCSTSYGEWNYSCDTGYAYVSGNSCTANTYNIIYKDGNTVLSDLGPTKYKYGTNTTINAIPIKTGYVFEGWFNSSNGGSEVKNINETETGDITLYAHWKMTASMCTKGTYLSEDAQSCVKCPTEYPDSDDGAESVSECYKDIATTCIQTEGPVPTNCSGVTEWNECSCTGTYRQYYDTHIVGATTEECTKTAKSLEAPLGYYVSGTTCLACASKPDNAKYTDSDNCAWACNAHYEKSGDICIACSSKNTTETESVTGGTRTRSVTYDNNASGSSCSASYGEWNYSCGTGYAYVSGNSCTANTYNIIYKDGNTVLSDLGPTKYTYGANMPISAIPIKTGYVFEGWFTSATGGQKLATVPSTLSQNIVVYARWSLKEYSITYHLNGGVNGVNNPETYSINTPTITLEEPSKEWYDFEGWYDNSKFAGKEITSISKEAQKDVHLYAKWKVHDCSVGEYRGYSACEICPENTYCPGDNAKYNCPSGSVSPAGSSNANSCGILLNVGSEKLYLTQVQETHPALAVRFNGKVYYAQTTPLNEGPKPMNKDATEQMILKLDNQTYSIHDNTIKGEL